MQNGVAGLIELIQEEGKCYNPPAISCGKVFSIAPLVVMCNDLMLTGNDLRVADYLVDGHVKDAVFRSTGSNNDTTGKITFLNALNIDDEVAMFESADGNTYFVLCKVVKV